MNHRQQLFANTYLRHNDPTIAYMEAYKPRVPNYRVIMSAANRLLRKPEIAEYISSVRDSVRSQLEYELKEQMKEELLTIHEKRLYIKRVINGEILIPQDYKTTGCNRCTMFIRPTFPQILGYLKEDSRLAGHYPDRRRSSTKPPATNNTSPRPGDLEVPLAPNPREQQQTTTTERSELAVTIEKDINQATNNIFCPPLAGVSAVSDGGGALAPNPREQQQTTTTGRSELVVTSHAGLRKLLNKQRMRRNGVIGRDTPHRNPYPNPSKQALIASKSGTLPASSSTSA
ncbi:MAG: terminase small subunit [Taibaiella sp.]|nr:terminase small subunit [Taibaiella sp.]